MSLVSTHIGNVRRHSGFPSETLLGDGMIIEYLIPKLAFYLNELNITGVQWNALKARVTLVPGRDEYLIVADRWGKPFMVETIETDSPPVPWREIPIVPVTDLSNYNYYHSSPSTDGFNPSTGCSFYADDSGTRMRVVPMPQETSQVLVRYEPEGFLLSGLDNTFPWLQNYDDLIDIDTAIAIIPSLGYTPDKVSALIGDATMGLTREFLLWKSQFDEYKTSNTEEETGVAQGFGIGWGL